MRKKRIGLFGGTFNPVHLGHLKAAQIVKDRFCLDKVLFIPSFIPPHKKTEKVAAASFRLDMVRLAVSDYPGFVPSSIEIDAGGKSYSIKTLAKIKRLYPKAEILFILGIDAFIEIGTWMDYQDVIKQCCFIVISRPGYSLHSAIRKLPAVIKNRICEASGMDLINLGMSSQCSIFLFPLDAMDIASTEIRRRVRAGKTIINMVSEEVIKYIKENNLYK